MSIDTLIDDISVRVERYINKEMEQIYAGPVNIGLDDRVGMIYINEECISVDKSRRGTFDYYGGGEYVDKEYVYTLGEYTFYLSGDDRIQGIIDRYFDRKSEEAA